MAAYVSYKVTTQLSQTVAGLDAQVYAVIRRFNDFVWLRGALRDALPYLIVPALPEKQQVRRPPCPPRSVPPPRSRSFRTAQSSSPRSRAHNSALSPPHPSVPPTCSPLPRTPAPRLPPPVRSGGSMTTSSPCATARCSDGWTASRRTRRSLRRTSSGSAYMSGLEQLRRLRSSPAGRPFPGRGRFFARVPRTPSLVLNNAPSPQFRPFSFPRRARAGLSRSRPRRSRGCARARARRW